MTLTGFFKKRCRFGGKIHKDELDELAGRGGGIVNNFSSGFSNIFCNVVTLPL